MRSSRVVVVLTVGAAVLLSAVALSEATPIRGGTAATPSSATPKPKSLTVTGTAISGLFPGSGVRDLVVTVSNPTQSTGAVRLESVTAAVTGTTDAKGQQVDGCRVGTDVTGSARSTFDVLVTSYRPPAGTGPLLERGSVGVPVALGIEMVDRPRNQNACKGVRISLGYTATAAGK